MLLLGSSGSGKSTLLAALAGLLDPGAGGDEEGELLVDGRRPDRARAGTGLVVQDPEDQIVLPRAGDDVAFGLENRCVPRQGIWPRVGAALDAVAFPYAADRPTSDLSGGELQRLALAGVIALRPSLLLLDEPASNLDAAAGARLRDTVTRLVAERQATLVIVEHRVAEWSDLVDRVVVMQAGGGVVADGRPADVFDRESERLLAAGVWVPDTRGSGQSRRRSVTAAGPQRIGPALVVAEQVTFRYPGSDVPAVSGLDAELRAGDVLAVTGPNGSGKSTFGLLLAGLLRPASGRVSATGALSGRPTDAGAGEDADADIWRWPARRLATRIGAVFQNPEHQFLCSRVDDELALGLRRTGAPAQRIEATVGELLERLDLASLAAANPFTLSGGEQRRLSVGAAIAAKPAVLILDEPTFGQDRRTHEELIELLADLRDGGTSLCLVTHDEAAIVALADRRLSLVRPPA